MTDNAPSEPANGFGNTSDDPPVASDIPATNGDGSSEGGHVSTRCMGTFGD